MDSQVFQPGDGIIPALPLERFLPPLPGGILSGWLKDSLPEGGWVIDPLGSTPQVALEAARSGFRILTACNNPIVALMIQVLAQAPSRKEFESAISTLADSRRAGERLEVHLSALYQTICPVCRKTIQADAYLWKKGGSEPYARVLRCPECGANGEYPIENEDRAALAKPGNLALLRSRALERIGIPYAAQNPVIREVIESYPDRAFYTLFNLINRIEALPVPEERRRYLQALLISACDAGNSLWPYPAGKTRPRLIMTPGEYEEVNLWKTFQEAVSIWAGNPGKVEVTIYPALPRAKAGICLYPGRFPALGQLPDLLRPQAALAVIPYPNQAFWSYSAVWSGWIWGKDTASALHGVLGRQRFDTRWVGAVLTAAFHKLPAGIPFHAEIPEVTSGLLNAALAAGLAGGVGLEGIACEQESSLAQVSWSTGYKNEIPLPGSMTHLTRDMIADALLERGEAATYLQLSGSGLERLIQLGVLPAGSPRGYDDLLTRIQQAQKECFEDPAFLRCFGSRSPDSQGTWWLQKLDAQPVSLADRVEEAILAAAAGDHPVSIQDIQKKLNGQFHGFLTPQPSLVDAILRSYFHLSSERPGMLQPDPARLPAAFLPEMPGMTSLLEKLGRDFGYEITGGEFIDWKGDGKTLFRIFTVCDGRISRWMGEFRGKTGMDILLCPEARQELLFYKIFHNAPLLEALGNWRLIGFDQLRRIAANNDPLWALRDALSDPGKTPDGSPAQISFLP